MSVLHTNGRGRAANGVIILMDRHLSQIKHSAERSENGNLRLEILQFLYPTC